MRDPCPCPIYRYYEPAALPGTPDPACPLHGDREGLTVVMREGVEPSESGLILERRYPRWFIVNAEGRMVAPGVEGYRTEAVAREALWALGRVTEAT